MEDKTMRQLCFQVARQLFLPLYKGDANSNTAVKHDMSHASARADCQEDTTNSPRWSTAQGTSMPSKKKLMKELPEDWQPLIHIMDNVAQQSMTFYRLCQSSSATTGSLTRISDHTGTLHLDAVFCVAAVVQACQPHLWSALRQRASMLKPRVPVLVFHLPLKVTVAVRELEKFASRSRHHMPTTSHGTLPAPLQSNPSALAKTEGLDSKGNATGSDSATLSSNDREGKRARSALSAASSASCSSTSASSLLLTRRQSEQVAVSYFYHITTPAERARVSQLCTSRYDRHQSTSNGAQQCDTSVPDARKRARSRKQPFRATDGDASRSEGTDTSGKDCVTATATTCTHKEKHRRWANKMHPSRTCDGHEEVEEHAQDEESEADNSECDEKEHGRDGAHPLHVGSKRQRLAKQPSRVGHAVAVLQDCSEDVDGAESEVAWVQLMAQAIQTAEGAAGGAAVGLSCSGAATHHHQGDTAYADSFVGGAEIADTMQPDVGDFGSAVAWLRLTQDITYATAQQHWRCVRACIQCPRLYLYYEIDASYAEAAKLSKSSKCKCCDGSEAGSNDVAQVRDRPSCRWCDTSRLFMDVTCARTTSLVPRPRSVLTAHFLWIRLLTCATWVTLYSNVLLKRHKQQRQPQQPRSYRDDGSDRMVEQENAVHQESLSSAMEQEVSHHIHACVHVLQAARAYSLPLRHSSLPSYCASIALAAAAAASSLSTSSSPSLARSGCGAAVVFCPVCDGGIRRERLPLQWISLHESATLLSSTRSTSHHSSTSSGAPGYTRVRVATSPKVADVVDRPAAHNECDEGQDSKQDLMEPESNAESSSAPSSRCGYLRDVFGRYTEARDEVVAQRLLSDVRLLNDEDNTFLTHEDANTRNSDDTTTTNTNTYIARNSYCGYGAGSYCKAHTQHDTCDDNEGAGARDVLVACLAERIEAIAALLTHAHGNHSTRADANSCSSCGNASRHSCYQAQYRNRNSGERVSGCGAGKTGSSVCDGSECHGWVLDGTPVPYPSATSSSASWALRSYMYSGGKVTLYTLVAHVVLRGCDVHRCADTLFMTKAQAHPHASLFVSDKTTAASSSCDAIATSTLSLGAADSVTAKAPLCTTKPMKKREEVAAWTVSQLSSLLALVPCIPVALEEEDGIIECGECLTWFHQACVAPAQNDFAQNCFLCHTCRLRTTGVAGLQCVANT